MWVGWESVEVHDAYHHRKHFRDRVVILREHNTMRVWAHCIRALAHPALCQFIGDISFPLLNIQSISSQSWNGVSMTLPVFKLPKVRSRKH